jgi:hypothetical protein
MMQRIVIRVTIHDAPRRSIMLVLVATTETQGEMSEDYAWTVDGELVTPLVEQCSTPFTCGCGRGFPGLASERATTTAMVVDRPELSPQMFRTVLADALERGGWAARREDAAFQALVDQHLRCIDHVCAMFPVGTVVNRCGEQIFAREIADAA